MTRSPNKWDAHIIFDVEADGPCPGLFNMISFGLVSLADPTQSFLGEVAPLLDHPGIAEGRDVSAIGFETQKTYRPASVVMPGAHAWLREIVGDKRPIFWSDNPAYDWQFWNWYSHRFVGDNPAGHSARRIGDLDAGRRGEPLNASAWKKRRVTTHTHNPVDDARGNAEALRWILTEMGEAFA